MGVRGTDKRHQWLKEQTKLEILNVIATSQQQGVSARHSCSLLADRTSPRRSLATAGSAGTKSGQSSARPPEDTLHRVLPEEIDQIVTMARRQEYVDLSHRILAVTAWDKGLFQASFSTVYRVLKEQQPDDRTGSWRGSQRQLQGAGPQRP
jgi:hypothetical protein